MDWSRAKTILIIVFALLNILLAYQLWSERLWFSSAQPELTDEDRALDQILTLKEIRLLTDLPEETPELGELTLNVHPKNGVPETIALDEPLPFDDLDIGKMTTEELSEALQQELSYVYSAADSREGVHVLFQQYEGYPLFDVKVELIVDGGMVTSLRRLRALELADTGNKGQQVLSARQALTILADKYLEPGEHIYDVRLGYHGQAFNSETRVLAPYWRILTAGGGRYYVHAITGAVE
jgi:regulatory protein YycI of two-component signal transduction system YycFG